MSDMAISSVVLPAAATAKSGAPDKVHNAAQQFAAVMAQQGGLGLAGLIAKGLKPKLATDEHR